MTILTVDVDLITRDFLRGNNYLVEEVTTEDLETFDIVEWINNDGVYTGCLINMDTIGTPYLCRPLRAKGVHVPVIGVGSPKDNRPWSDYRALFLEQGGDDLVQAPSNPRELAASIRAAQRRVTSGKLEPVLVVENGANVLRVDLTSYHVSLNGYRLDLTGLEARVFEELAKANGKILGKDALLSRVYSLQQDLPEAKIVDVVICRLRRKLDWVVPGAGQDFIKTVWGRGYQLTSSK